MTIALGTRPEANLYPRRKRGPVSGAVANATPSVTAVALIPSVGILPKHARDRFSRTTNFREKSMPVAKHSSSTRLRLRTERSRRINGSLLENVRVHRNETAHALPQQASVPRPAIASVSAASRSIFQTLAQLVDSAGDILLAIATWAMMEILAGCVAYARAMHGIPEAADHGESSDQMPTPPPAPPKNPSRPTLQVISADREGAIRTGELFSRPVPLE